MRKILQSVMMAKIWPENYIQDLIIVISSSKVLNPIYITLGRNMPVI
jgi:hypothetical protein